MPEMRLQFSGADANGLLSNQLPVQEVRPCDDPEARRLLRLLFIRECAVSPDSRSKSKRMMLLSLVRFPLIFISGAFISLSDMTGLGLVATHFSPLFYLVDGIGLPWTRTQSSTGVSTYSASWCSRFCSSSHQEGSSAGA